MIDKNIKLRARALYMAGVSLAQIAGDLEININTIKFWVDKGGSSEAAWKDVRQLDTDAQLVDMLHDREAGMSEIFSLGMGALLRGMAHIELNKVVLETSAMTQLVKILDSVDKWQRLDADDRDTSNEISIDDAEDSIAEHPFLKIKDNT